jgi:hypothetical protein
MIMTRPIVRSAVVAGTCLLAFGACQGNDVPESAEAIASSDTTAGSVILGRPTSRQVSVSVIPTSTIETYCEFGC